MLNFVFLKTSLSTISLSFLKPKESVFNFPTSKSSTFDFELFQLVGTLVSLLMSSLSTSVFVAIASFLAAKSDVSMSVSCSNSF